MPQVFHRSTNTIARVSIFGALFVVAAAGFGLDLINRSPYVTQAMVAREQPVPFSHRHHAGQLGIDCRYCHTSVETSGKAGIPPTQTCMNCHKQIWSDSPMLEPVRASLRTDVSIPWIKVHDLPDFVYFNHSVHIAKGIGCVTCHGQVDRMPLMFQHASLQMEWCLKCHQDPGRFVRPREQVFNLNWEPPADPREAAALQARLIKEYNVRSLTSCSTCHR